MKRHTILLLEILLFALLATSSIFYGATQRITPQPVVPQQEAFTPEPTAYIKSFDKENFLRIFDAELEFWLSIIPHEQLVYDVMDHNYGIPKPLIFSVVKNESSFNERAVGRTSTSEDYGLFQLNSSVYAQYTKDQLIHQDNNIALGMYHLYTELERFNGDVESAVKAYNAGPARVMAGTEPESTKQYWNKIRRDMIEYQMLYRRYMIAFKEVNYGKSYF